MDALNAITARLGLPLGYAQPAAGRVWGMLTFGNRLSHRTSVMLWLIAAIALALYFGWSLIVAAGMSALVLSMLPCAAICALGLCAVGSAKKCASVMQKAKGDEL